MTWSPDSSITGGAQSNLTTPTYTLASDLAPDANSRQYVVTALGGTQTGVRASSAGDPFTVTIRKDRTYKVLPARNPVNGSYPNVPMNKTELLFRKGVYIDTDQTTRTANIRVIAELPAGSEVNDPANIRALCSFLVGILNEESQDYGDSLVTGII
jgi:hypothetical protein